jgi:large subunit ribosomal protein L3
MTHGSKNHRAPGSIGQGSTPGRVYPGKKMPGQLGNKKTTISKLQILKIDNKENLLIVKGSVPGKPGNLLSIKPTKRK